MWCVVCMHVCWHESVCTSSWYEYSGKWTNQQNVCSNKTVIKITFDEWNWSVWSSRFDCAYVRVSDNFVFAQPRAHINTNQTKNRARWETSYSRSWENTKIVSECVLCTRLQEANMYIFGFCNLLCGRVEIPIHHRASFIICGTHLHSNETFVSIVHCGQQTLAGFGMAQHINCYFFIS